MSYESIRFDEVAGNFLGVLENLQRKVDRYEQQLETQGDKSKKQLFYLGLQKDSIRALEDFFEVSQQLILYKQQKSRAQENAELKGKLKRSEQQNQELRLFAAYMKAMGESHYVRLAHQTITVNPNKEFKRQATFALAKQKWAELY